MHILNLKLDLNTIFKNTTSIRLDVGIGIKRRGQSIHLLCNISIACGKKNLIRETEKFLFKTAAPQKASKKEKIN